jgi:hypothetical protein
LKEAENSLKKYIDTGKNSTDSSDIESGELKAKSRPTANARNKTTKANERPPRNPNIQLFKYLILFCLVGILVFFAAKFTSS